MRTSPAVLLTSKATDQFIIYPKRGAEFLDLDGYDHMRHDWLRGSCRFGVLPCNGLLYTPPDQCFCYVGAKLDGLVATSSANITATLDPRSPQRLSKGPAHESPPATPATSGDWPAFRADAKRSGSNREAYISRQLQPKWEVTLGGKLTQPTIAAGRVFVAAVDRHTVHALDAATGEPLWKFIAGGRVDSSPTYHAGLLLFGANDGRVYCLNATTGELVWRFLAAPNERRIVAFGQVESPWPVHGSVLVMNSLAYVVAGRSTFIDGGAHGYALEPRTGNVVRYRRIDQPQPDLSKDIGEHFAMDGFNIEAMALTRDTLFAAGPPDVLKSDDPLGALQGRLGGVLLVIDPTTGEQLSQVHIPSPPRFDGMAAAGNRLFLVTQDGTLLAWE